jgi:hypothetical protein
MSTKLATKAYQSNIGTTDRSTNIGALDDTMIPVHFISLTALKSIKIECL